MRHSLRAEHEQLADELLADPEQPADRTLTLLARVAVGVSAAFLLCTATIGAAAISAYRPERTHGVVAAEPIRGISAFRPDLVRAARWPFAGNAGFGRASDLGEAPRSLTAGGHDPAIGLATEFYRRLDTDPAQAANLLAPALLDGQRSEFVSSWGQIRTLQVMVVTESADGPIVAEVLATYAEGDRVLLRHRLVVASGAPPAIVDAELLAARHLTRA